MDEMPTSSPGSTPDDAMILRFKDDKLVDPKANDFDVHGKLTDLFAPARKPDLKLYEGPAD